MAKVHKHTYQSMIWHFAKKIVWGALAFIALFADACIQSLHYVHPLSATHCSCCSLARALALAARNRPSREGEQRGWAARTNWVNKYAFVTLLRNAAKMAAKSQDAHRWESNCNDMHYSQGRYRAVGLYGNHSYLYDKDRAIRIIYTYENGTTLP